MSEKNTLNFTFNFNAPVGQNIAHVDHLEAHFDKDMTMQVVDTKAMEASPQPSPEESEVPSLWERTGGEVAFVRAVEAVQSFFWAQSSWAVVYCVCRDYMGIPSNVSDFERRVQALSFSKTNVMECRNRTIQKTLENNDYMGYPVNTWPKRGAKERVLLLAEKLLEELKKE